MSAIKTAARRTLLARKAAAITSSKKISEEDRDQKYQAKFLRAFVANFDYVLWDSCSRIRQDRDFKEAQEKFEKLQKMFKKTFPTSEHEVYSKMAPSASVLWQDLWYHQKEPFLKEARRNRRAHALLKRKMEALKRTPMQSFQRDMRRKRVFDIVPNKSMWTALPPSTKERYGEMAEKTRDKAKTYFRELKKLMSN